MIGTCKFKVRKYLKYISHQILVGSASSVVLCADFFRHYSYFNSCSSKL